MNGSIKTAGTNLFGGLGAHLSVREILRLSFPRRLFTLSQTEYVIDRVKWLYDHREMVHGLRFVHEPKTLRFFTGVLEPVDNWP
ncbi:MAG: hypothetical protein IJG17_00380 [Eubacterium sp.]|nr:hypothetical protein [Eubacterium sp.]MBQ6489582.1 hypothetical protein [Solobacterium sp.]